MYYSQVDEKLDVNEMSSTKNTTKYFDIYKQFALRTTQTFLFYQKHRLGNNSRATQMKFVFECRITPVISIISASQLHFLANRNAELAVCSQ